MPRWVVTQRTAANQAGSGGAPPRPDPTHIVAPVKPVPAPADTSTPQTPDSYAEKLVKYVPAEVLAFALPAAGLNAGNDGWLKAIVAAGVVTTPLYLVSSARTRPAAQRPPTAYYILSTLAFLPWILGASPAVAGMTGWGQGRTTTILMFAVLVIPLLDQLLDAPPVAPAPPPAPAPAPVPAPAPAPAPAPPPAAAPGGA